MTDADVIAVLTRIADELAGIRMLLEVIAAPEPEPKAEPGCPHPEDERVSFGMTNGLPDWECRLCQFRSIPPETVAPCPRPPRCL